MRNSFKSVLHTKELRIGRQGEPPALSLISYLIFTFYLNALF